MDVIKEENVGLVENIIFFQEMLDEMTFACLLNPYKLEEIDFTQKAELFLEWSNEFEELHKDENWECADYIEEIDKFTESKLKERFGNGEDD